jgi:hypothetical protein
MTNTSGNIYSAIIPAQVPTSVVSYYVEASNAPSLTVVYPATAPTTNESYTVRNSPLVLNEVCGKQIPDDDWVEFYNNSSSEIDISGIKIVKTDEVGGVSTIYTAAAGKKIAANSYVLVPTLVASDFGYGILTGGISNTKSVKLEVKTSNDVVLSSFEKTATVPNVAGHVTGGSYARIPDITGDWAVAATYTKGTANPSSK